jgi:D-alanyl-D-alanine carboxypeptidase/D-alanyl-D-alanine-endopeptidase (penicillin-binding protein 4)
MPPEHVASLQARAARRAQQLLRGLAAACCAAVVARAALVSACSGAAFAAVALILQSATVLAAPPGTAISGRGALPRPVGRAFLDARVPLNTIAVVVQEVGAARPLVAHDAARPMNPASVMKLYTTLAALELLGRDYRWTTDAYLAGPLVAGTLQGDLVLKGRGDPKITVQQWQDFMATLRSRGLATVDGDLVLDRTEFALPPHDPAAFDGESLRPYNVGPDAMLVNFKAVRFAFAPNGTGDGTILRTEPPLAEVAVSPPPPPAAGPCNDWRASIGAAFIDRGDAASATFAGRFPASCGERDWHVALLDHPHYVRGMFATYFGEAGGRFTGGVREGRPPAGAAPFATMASAPLYDIVRDINKLSNNVMARQVFLTLATTAAPPPATPAGAADSMRRWLDRRKIDRRGFVVENGSGLSRHERSSAAGLAQLLAAADSSPVREEFASSLAVAAVDGTLARRFTDRPVAGQALLKTGSLEGVRALAGYVIDAESRRWIVVAIINHANAVRGQPALDALVQWVYRDAAAWSRAFAQ